MNSAETAFDPEKAPEISEIAAASPHGPVAPPKGEEDPATWHETCAIPNPLLQEPTQEVDLWWGSYSGWTMLPSFAVCIVLTALIFWVVTRFLPHRELVQLTILGASGSVWLVQLT